MNVNKLRFICVGLLMLTLCFSFLSPVHAITTGLQETAEKAGVKIEAEPAEIVGSILKVIISFLGIVLLIVIIYGGFLWMTAGGDETQVKKAKDWILNGVIGLVIILLAYAVTDYIVGQILEATRGGGEAEAGEG